MEERYCCLTGFIQTKMKQLELSGPPELNVTTELSVKLRLTQLSIPKFSGNLQDWFVVKDTFLSSVGDSITIANIQKFCYLLSAISGGVKRVIQHILSVNRVLELHGRFWLKDMKMNGSS
jgi:hypothetical protein